MGTAGAKRKFRDTGSGEKLRARGRKIGAQGQKTSWGHEAEIKFGARGQETVAGTGPRKLGARQERIVHGAKQEN